MKISVGLVYPALALMTILASMFLIPRKQYKKYILYSSVIGGIIYLISFLIFSVWLNLFEYKNFGVLNIGGYESVWTPITFIFMFAIFLYLMPVRKTFLVLYFMMWAGIHGVVGSVLQSLGLIVYSMRYGLLLDMTIMTFWHLLLAWIYIKAEKIEILSSPIKKRQGYSQESKISRYMMTPAPARKQAMRLDQKKNKPQKK